MNRSWGERWSRLALAGFRVGSVRGIPVNVHPMMPLLFVVVLAGAVERAGWERGLLYGSLGCAILLASVLFHELGHCWGASLAGGGADRILLGPFGGLAFTSASDRSPYDEFIVTLPGPLASLLLAAIGGFMAWALPPWIDIESRALSVSYSVFHDAWAMLGAINAGLFLFNVLIPMFPLDCARLVRSLLAMRHSPGRVTHDLCLLGLPLAGVLLCLAFVPLFASDAGDWLHEANILLGCIAVMGAQACLIELERIRHEDVYHDPWHGRRNFEAMVLAAKALFIPRLRMIRTDGPPPGSPPPAKPRPPGESRRTHGAGPTPPRPMRPGKPERTARIRDVQPPPPSPRELTRSRPGGASQTPAQVLEIRSVRNRLSEELEEAIRREDFLEAARLRDRIRSLPERDRTS